MRYLIAPTIPLNQIKRLTKECILLKWYSLYTDSLKS